MQPKGLKLYWLATRPFSFTASATPVLLGTAIAWVTTSNFNLMFFILALVGGMAVHAVANLLSDRFDLAKGLDRMDNAGAQNILLKGWMTPRQHRIEIIVLLILALAIAAYFVITAGTFVLYLCIVGLIFVLFYTAPPLKFKYIGLGDLAIFLSFGILMTLGAYYIQTHTFSWLPAIYAIPIALLVDAILHANNYRDITSDRAAGITTLAIALGFSGARMMYYVLVIGAYLSIPLMILFAHLSPFALFTFITLPIAFKVIKKAANRDKLDAQTFAIIDVETAQLHMMFGLSMTIGLVVSHFV